MGFSAIKKEKKKKTKNREMPSLEENLGEEDDFENSKPMTYEQLKQLAIKRLVSSPLIANRMKARLPKRARTR